MRVPAYRLDRRWWSSWSATYYTLPFASLNRDDLGSLNIGIHGGPNQNLGIKPGLEGDS